MISFFFNHPPQLARNRVCYKDSSSDVEQEPASVYSESNAAQV